MMRASVRILAVMVLVLFGGMTSFADDAAKPGDGAKKSDGAAASATASAPAKSDAAEKAQPSVGLFPRPTPPRPATSFSTRSDTTPAVETFLGYSYLRLSTTNRPLTAFPTVNVPDHFDLQGATESITGSINNWLGLVADFGQVRTWHIAAGSTKVYSFLFGPQISYRKMDRITPFFHALFGAAYARGNPSLSGEAHQNAFATAVGVGLDVKASQHVSVRLFQIDYFGTKFSDTSKVQQNQNNVRLSGGIVLRFGYPSAPPPPPPPPVNHPPVASCSANPASVIAGSGDTIAVRAQASDPDNDPLTYAWSASAGSVDGSGPEVRWNPGNAGPGSYTVSARVDDGRGGSVSCSSDVKVEPKPNRPPTISCAAAPASVEVGENVGVTATASDPDNDPLTYSWQTSGGQLTGTGANVQLTSATPGRVTVKGRVDDGRGGTADCETGAEFTPHKPTAIELRLALHSIYFVTAQPTPKNPNAGLVLSQQKTLVPVAADFKVYLQTHSDAKLILEGHADPRGGVEYNQGLSERRVARTKKALVDLGVPEAGIETKAYGQQKNMTDAEVREAVNTNPDLTPGERKRIMANERIIILASNRRVDITLSTTGQTSIRHFPFSAEDALSLIGGREKPKPAAKPAPRRARPGAGKAPGKAAGKAPAKAAPKKQQ